MTMLEQSWHLTLRNLRFLLRQPWYIGVTLVQPVIWLVLFGALFKNITQIPGFTSPSYIDYLTPGVVIMSALFSSGWLGMGFIEAMDRGVINRFLTSPTSRGALIVGSLAYGGIVTAVQSLIIVGVGVASGARYSSLAGVALLLLVTILISTAFGSFSNAVALLLRKQESLIGAVNFLVLPLAFLSSIFMQQSLMPRWIQVVATYNPVNWAVAAGRAALASGANWHLVAEDSAYLLLLAVVCAWLSTRAFRSYQRSL
ncbi:MAG TPA: ABC transporter permease [Chloroflexota bacterium]|nr:ABC transporter permease [Chloroflexota bacterium]